MSEHCRSKYVAHDRATKVLQALSHKDGVSSAILAALAAHILVRDKYMIAADAFQMAAHCKSVGPLSDAIEYYMCCSH